MHDQRVESPSVDALAELEDRLAAGTRVTVQFAAPPYPASLLAQLNRLAVRYGDRIEVRFYGHYGSSFDCSNLAHLRDVVSLSLDCLSHADALHELASLERLTTLSLGIFELSNGDALTSPNLRSLSTLILGETRKRVFDLAALDGCSRLSHLRVCGHTRNLSTIASLPSLSELWLNGIPKKAPISFVSDMRRLTSLHVYLGGRGSLADVSAPTLETLEVVRVRGLLDIGGLSRFPALRRLLVEDQIQLEQVMFGSENSALEVVHLYNCKSLRAVPGIERVPRLKEMRVFRTAMEPEALRRGRLSDSLQQLAFGTGKASMDRRVREKSSALGYDSNGAHANVFGIDWERRS